MSTSGQQVEELSQCSHLFAIGAQLRGKSVTVHPVNFLTSIWAEKTTVCVQFQRLLSGWDTKLKATTYASPRWCQCLWRWPWKNASSWGRSSCSGSSVEPARCSPGWPADILSHKTSPSAQHRQTHVRLSVHIPIGIKFWTVSDMDKKVNTVPHTLARRKSSAGIWQI